MKHGNVDRSILRLQNCERDRSGNLASEIRWDLAILSGRELGIEDSSPDNAYCRIPRFLTHSTPIFWPEIKTVWKRCVLLFFSYLNWVLISNEKSTVYAYLTGHDEYGIIKNASSHQAWNVYRSRTWKGQLVFRAGPQIKGNWRNKNKNANVERAQGWHSDIFRLVGQNKRSGP